nr:response regulator transcription factor [Clostridioides difficile]
MPNKLLVIDDDLDMLDLVRIALEKDGHQVDTEADAATVQTDRCQMYDLLLLDVMMPGEDGFSLCNRIRSEVDCPILFLTAKAEDAALVKGFGLGADDYIKKPFSIAELRARVNAHLRRDVRQPTRILSRGGMRLDMQAKVAIVGEHTLPFTKGEYAICEYLALHAGQVFTKEQLYEAVFGFDAEGDSSAIAEHIKNIRAKLKDDGLSPIETVWGVGYKWRKDSAL